jgi:hypothetical protein
LRKKGKLFSDAHLITSKGSMNFGYQEVKFLIYEVGRSRKSIKIKSFHGARLSPSPSLSLSCVELALLLCTANLSHPSSTSPCRAAKLEA